MAGPIAFHSSNADAYDRELADGASQLLGASYFERVIDNIYRSDYKLARAHVAKAKQARIAQAMAMGDLRVNETLEVPLYKVAKEYFHDWAWKFRDDDYHPDYECWDDSDFIKVMLRDNPEMRVRETRNMSRVGWTPPARPPQKRGITLTDERGNEA